MKEFIRNLLKLGTIFQASLIFKKYLNEAKLSSSELDMIERFTIEQKEKIEEFIIVINEYKKSAK